MRYLTVSALLLLMASPSIAKGDRPSLDLEKCVLEQVARFADLQDPISTVVDVAFAFCRDIRIAMELEIDLQNSPSLRPAFEDHIDSIRSRALVTLAEARLASH